MSARSFVRSPPTMQPSWLGLSLVTLRQSNNPPNWKFQTQWAQKRRDIWRANQEHDYHFLWHQGIRPDRPNSKFRILLWQFTDTARKCAKTSLRTLATKELVAATQQRSSTLPLLTYSPHMAPCNLSVTLVEDKTERPPFLYNWGDWDRIPDGVEHPHRTRLPGCILKKWKHRSTGNSAYARKETTLRVMVASRPKVCFDQMATTVPEIMDVIKRLTLAGLPLIWRKQIQFPKCCSLAF
jgi:hypothetical protein